MPLSSSLADKATVSAKRAASRSSMFFNKLKESTTLINELKDKINDEKKIIEDFCIKVDEYEVMIDCMEQKYEEKCSEHCTKITLIEAYYQELITKNSPHYVMKHWVKNKESRGKCIVFSILSICSFNKGLTNKSTQHHWAYEQIMILQRAILPPSPMCYVILGGYELTVQQGLARHDITRILIVIMYILSQGGSVGKLISL